MGGVAEGGAIYLAGTSLQLAGDTFLSNQAIGGPRRIEGLGHRDGGDARRVQSIPASNGDGGGASAAASTSRAGPCRSAGSSFSGDLVQGGDGGFGVGGVHSSNGNGGAAIGGDVNLLLECGESVPATTRSRNSKMIGGAGVNGEGPGSATATAATAGRTSTAATPRS